jgi:hypothetical protein
MNRHGFSMISPAERRGRYQSSQVSELTAFRRTCGCDCWPLEGVYVPRRRLCWSSVRTRFERVSQGFGEFLGAHESLTCDDGDPRVQKCRSAAEPSRNFGIRGVSPHRRGAATRRRGMICPQRHEADATLGPFLHFCDNYLQLRNLDILHCRHVRDE